MIRTRAAVAADAMAIARVHVRAWRDGYRGLLPDQYLDGLRPEERAARYRLEGPDPDPHAPVSVVALDGDVICGFAVSGPARDDDASGLGEVLALYVDPGVWRRGVGGRLMRDARIRLAERGFTDAILWLLAGNERGRAFYLDDGWVPDGMTRTEEIWGVRVDEVRYRRTLSDQAVPSVRARGRRRQWNRD